MRHIHCDLVSLHPFRFWLLPCALFVLAPACTGQSTPTQTEATERVGQPLGAVGAPLALGTKAGGATGTGQILLFGNGGLFRTLASSFGADDRVAAGDVDGDKLDEIIVGYAHFPDVTPPGGASVTGGPIFVLNQFGRPLVNHALEAFTFLPGSALASGDVNKDGFDEIVYGQADGSVFVIARDGTSLGNFFGPGGPPSFARGSDLAVCDLNHDGFDDIILAPGFQIFTDPSVTFGTYFTGPPPPFNIGTDKLACADLNNDGFADLIIARGSSGDFQIVTHPSRPPITFFPNGAPAFGQLDAVAAGDIDGDGMADIAVGHVELPSSGGPVLPGGIRLFGSPGKTPAPIFLGQTTFQFIEEDSIAIGRHTANADLDTDGDGLLDTWETNGIDFDGDGCIDLDLASLGADPLRKDIFVEVDWMDCTLAGGDCAPGDGHNHKPTTANLAPVVAAFNNAPVPNPGGRPSGINLHILPDEAVPHKNACGFDQTCFLSLKSNFFGTAADRAGITRPTCNSSAAAVLGAKSAVFHYNIWVHSQTSGSSGISNAPGNNFMVSLAGFAGFPNGMASWQAGTFMHELGHNLGLSHGGGDSINRKPNYLSVMNYEFQATGLPPAGNVDYSRVKLPDLFETGGPVPGLDENVGIQGGTAGLQTRFYCPNDLRNTNNATPANDVGPINWDCKPPPDLSTDVGIVGDINNDRTCIGPGASGILASKPGGDDFTMGGAIGPGPNMKLDSAIISTGVQGDDQVVGQVIFPGGDDVLDSSPSMGDDDFVTNRIVPANGTGQGLFGILAQVLAGGPTVTSVAVVDDVAVRIILPGPDGLLETPISPLDIAGPGNTILPGQPTGLPTQDTVLTSAASLCSNSPGAVCDDQVVVLEILPGPDLILESTVAVGALDVPDSFLINPGPDMTLDSNFVSKGLQGDDVVGPNNMVNSVLPGPDGILQTVPSRDDVQTGTFIVDGPNRVCETVASSGDTVAQAIEGDNSSGLRNPGHVEPPILTSFNDWSNLKYQFRGTSDVASGTLVEMTVAQLIEATQRTAVADVAISASASTDLVAEQSSLTFHVSVTNNGGDSAVGLTIRGQLPPSSSMQSCIAPGAACLSGAGLFGATFDSLSPGQSVVADFVVKVGCSLAVGSTFDTVLSVQTISGDPIPANNSVTLTTTVIAPTPTVTVSAPPSNQCPQRPLVLPASHDICGNATPKTVVTSDNPAVTVPLVLTGPNVTLPAGTYTLQWTTFDGVNTSSVGEIIHVLDACLVELGLFATDRLAIDEDVRIMDETGGFAPIANSGEDTTSIGRDTNVGSVLSTSSIDIEEGAHIHGLAKSSGQITLERGAVVDGGVLPKSPVHLPDLSSFGVTFPVTSLGDVSVRPHSSVSLNPGSYGWVRVAPGSTLSLSPGAYFFRRLDMNPDSLILADTRIARVAVYVRDSFKDEHGNVGVPIGAPLNLLISYQGNDTLVLDGPFAATLVAPNASVVLASDKEGTLRGAFFGRNVEVRRDISLTHVALPPH